MRIRNTCKFHYLDNFFKANYIQIIFVALLNLAIIHGDILSPNNDPNLIDFQIKY